MEGIDGSKPMLSQAYAAIAVVILALAGLVIANLLYDRGVPKPLSRSVAPFLGGTAFLIGVAWLDARTAIALSGALTISVLTLRLGFRRGLRGVEGSGPAQAWAEIAYPMAGTASLAVGWGLLNSKWLALLPILFMAFGDNAAGLSRASIWRGKAASVWPSAAMLGVSLAVAALFQPYWIGALGAVAATVAERFRPTTRSLWDDNWVIVAVSLTVMSVAAQVTSSGSRLLLPLAALFPP